MFHDKHELDQRREEFLKDYVKDRELYQRYADSVLDLIKATLKKMNIEIAYASARSKTYESLRNKCLKSKYTDFRNQIMDLAGVRIVVYLRDDISIVTNVIENLFSVRKEDSGDKLELLGVNKMGYLSVHYIITLKEDMINPSNSEFKNKKCEVQVRTVLEDAWSQIFHDRQYKTAATTTISEDLKRRTNLISGSLELIDRTINDLVTEYDKEHQDQRKLRLLLPQPITCQSLLEYIRLSLHSIVRFYNYDEIESLCASFGIRTIRALNELIESGHMADDFRKWKGTILADQVIKYTLLVHDPDKYMKLINPSELRLPSTAIEFLSKKIEIRTYCERYGVAIQEYDEPTA